MCSVFLTQSKTFKGLVSDYHQAQKFFQENMKYCQKPSVETHDPSTFPFSHSIITRLSFSSSLPTNSSNYHNHATTSTAVIKAFNQVLRTEANWPASMTGYNTNFNLILPHRWLSNCLTSATLDLESPRNISPGYSLTLLTFSIKCNILKGLTYSSEISSRGLFKISLTNKKCRRFFPEIAPALLLQTNGAKSLFLSNNLIPLFFEREQHTALQKKTCSTACNLMHSRCAYCTVTVPKTLNRQTCGVWMEAWLEHTACQLHAVDQLYLLSFSNQNNCACSLGKAPNNAKKTTLMHSHCADCTVTVPKYLNMKTGGIWMASWLEYAAFQLQTVEQVKNLLILTNTREWQRGWWIEITNDSPLQYKFIELNKLYNLLRIGQSLEVAAADSQGYLAYLMSIWDKQEWGKNKFHFSTNYIYIFMCFHLILKCTNIQCTYLSVNHKLSKTRCSICNQPFLDAQPTRRCGAGPGGLWNQFVHEWGLWVKFLRCGLFFQEFLWGAMHLGHFISFSHTLNSLKTNCLVQFRFNLIKYFEKELWKKSQKRKGGWLCDPHKLDQRPP
ncbi:hypothetical protein VP01_4345g1 [Puccinia sorghi]|uniref:Uncharacterized protein n=1 Tax=Puccinia sorghi TaxID=27349 RepID=A0A0L6URV4_9BASI|nr:hypothetical protein VP01_4345g1 [Puccinia sorghi]